MELADVVASGGVPVGGVEAEAVDGGDPGVDAVGAVAPVDDAGVVALVGGGPGEPLGGGRLTVAEDRMTAGSAALARSAPARWTLAGVSASLGCCSTGSGLGIRSARSWSRRCPVVEQLGAAGELGSATGRARSASIWRRARSICSTLSARVGGESVVEVEDRVGRGRVLRRSGWSLSPSMRVQMPVPGISRRIPSLAVGVVGDPGEGEGGALVPAHRAAAVARCRAGSASCGRSVSMVAIWSVSRPMVRSASPIWRPCESREAWWARSARSRRVVAAVSAASSMWRWSPVAIAAMVANSSATVATDSSRRSRVICSGSDIAWAMKWALRCRICHELASAVRSVT